MPSGCGGCRCEVRASARPLDGFPMAQHQGFDASGGFDMSRYNRVVSWTRSLSVLVLAVLVGLPASGTLCAVLCSAAASSTISAPGHHGSSEACAETDSTPAAGGTIQGGALHDCSTHNATAQLVSASAQSRPDSRVSAPSVVPVRALAMLSAATRFQSDSEYSTIPGAAPPTATPLVLRV